MYVYNIHIRLHNSVVINLKPIVFLTLIFVLEDAYANRLGSLTQYSVAG